MADWAFNMDSMLLVEDAESEEEAITKGIEQLRDTLMRYTVEELRVGFEWYCEEE